MNKVENILHQTLFNSVLGLAYIISIIPGLSGFGKGLISSRHLGIASRAEQAGSYDIAAKHYQKVIDISPSESTKDIARVALGTIYQRGVGVGQDLDKATELFMQAGSNGNSKILGAEALRSFDDVHKKNT